VPTIPELVRRAVAAHSERVAIVDGERQLSFAEVGDRANRLANVFAARSRKDDGAVALLMRNRLEYLEADFAVAIAGKIKVPINPRLSDDERSYILRDSDAGILVTEAAELDRVTAMLDGFDDPPLLVVVDSTTGTSSYADLLAAASNRPPDVPHSSGQTSGQTSQLLYTSGTTGRPKGAMLSDGNRVAATLAMLAEEFNPGPDDGMIHAGPMSHGSGSKVLSFFTRGARNVVMPRFDPELFARAVEAGGTSSFMVPTMLHMLVDAFAPGSFPRLRNVTYGGSGISTGGLRAALQLFGPILTQVYGSCEAPHPVTVLRHRDEDYPDFPEDDSIPAGRAVSTCDYQVVDSDGGQADVGELWVRGPNTMAGYWNQPEATAAVLVDGWYHTGDVVRVADNGLLYIVDRIKDMIITGGLNVYPAEVERVLRAHPDVTDVCVLGLPDDRWGELVAAAFVLHPGRTVDLPDLTGWCASRLAGYKTPRRLAVLDTLPTGSTGKVVRSKVREMFQSERLTGTEA
jgi:acyl-CoA synthetase (AMP-forming)/AMP-acid ligase II